MYVGTNNGLQMICSYLYVLPIMSFVFGPDSGFGFDPGCNFGAGVLFGLSLDSVQRKTEDRVDLSSVLDMVSIVVVFGHACAYAMVFAHSAGELGFALSARRKTESKFHSAVATVLDFV